MSKSAMFLDLLKKGTVITIDSEYVHGFHYCSDGILRASKDANPRPDCPFCKLEITKKCPKKS